jgi:O-antigen ligase
VVTRTDRLRTLFWTLALSSLPLGLTALKNAATGVTAAGGTRIAGYTSGLATNPNDLALMLNILMPLTVALALTARNRTQRLGAIAIIAINAAAIVATFSRGGFVTLAATALLTAVGLMRRGRWGLIGAGALALAVAIPSVPSSYVDRLSTILNAESDTTGSSQERLELMGAATDLIQLHPVLGSGLGMDATAVNAIRSLHWRRVHNAYLVYAVDLGIPGLLIFLAALCATVGTAWRIEREPADGDPGQRDLPTLAQGVRISLLSFAVAANFSPVPYDFYFYYLAGLSVAAWHCRTPRTSHVAVSASTSRS